MLRWVVLVALLAGAAGPAEAASLTGFLPGEAFNFECASFGNASAWLPSFHCVEDGSPFDFSFGLDAFIRCTVHIASSAEFDALQDIVDGKAAWRCRVPMSIDKTAYIPVAIGLWGSRAGPARLKVNPHLQFVFHAHDGFIGGAAVYSVQDKFTVVQAGGTIHFHGPIRWFRKHSYQGLSSLSAREPMSHTGVSGTSVVLSSLTTSVLTLCVCVAVYELLLKPRLLRHVAKQR